MCPLERRGQGRDGWQLKGKGHKPVATLQLRETHTPVRIVCLFSQVFLAPCACTHRALSACFHIGFTVSNDFCSIPLCHCATVIFSDCPHLQAASAWLDRRARRQCLCRERVSPLGARCVGESKAKFERGTSRRSSPQTLNLLPLFLTSW